ncbi:hypothetical protein TSOC_014246 [Tetrabaena socialis]|uniref:Uncharacterized protein n=1 Tax=Tetrabaena socialis TaxID=47790 RepID=A0A2J7ZI72_9CHLO|nr:hypothetical protein TSOC_014246 [Tetrabaena socialis]|eukprot:PNG99957.1 hypothetical protein TSOC_014246 [Tetrabaena socialis]
MNNRQFKTFANTAARPVMRNPHRPILYKPSAVPHPHLVDELGGRIQSGMTNKPTHARAAIFHFVTKSWQDYEEKIKRGGGAGVRRDAGFFHSVQNRSTHACRQALDLSQRLCAGAGAQQLPQMQQLSSQLPQQQQQK